MDHSDEDEEAFPFSPIFGVTKEEYFGMKVAPHGQTLYENVVAEPISSDESQ